MGDTVKHLVELCAVLSRWDRRSPSTISRLATGSGQTISRLESGRDITTRRADRALRWFSNHWPEHLEWPPDVPRPEPSHASEAKEAA